MLSFSEPLNSWLDAAASAWRARDSPIARRSMSRWVPWYVSMPSPGCSPTVMDVKCPYTRVLLWEQSTPLPFMTRQSLVETLICALGMLTGQLSISVFAISLRSSGVMSSTLLSHTSGMAILACPGCAYPLNSVLSGEYLRTDSAMDMHSPTEESPFRVTDALPCLPPSAMRTIRPESSLVSMLLIFESSM